MLQVGNQVFAQCLRSDVPGQPSLTYVCTEEMKSKAAGALLPEHPREQSASWSFVLFHCLGSLVWMGSKAPYARGKEQGLEVRQLPREGS